MATVRNDPRMTFSALCEYLKASPTRQMSILRAQKFPKGGPIKSYENALRQAVNFAVDGAAFNLNAINLESHEQEIVEALIDNGWIKPAPLVRRPSTRQSTWTIRGVEVSVFPELELEVATGKKRSTGAYKFYPKKSPELDADVGRWVASFLYEYRLQVLSDTDADPDLCFVYDIRNDNLIQAGKSSKMLFRNIDNACLMIAALWPRIA